MRWSKFGQNRRQRLEILQLTSLLNRWCQVRENLVYAFERCTDQSLSPALNQAIQDLLTRIRGGMPPEQALAIFQKYSALEAFQDLMIALRFNFRHRGRLAAMLDLLELQQNKLEEAYSDRSISNRTDLLLCGLLLFSVPVILAARLLTSPAIRALFLEQDLGRLLLILAGLSFGAAMIGYVRIYRTIRS
jgi:Flp pilus assembly protein TadB